MARESNDESGVPIESFVAPRRPPRGDACIFQAFFDAPGLARFLAEPAFADEITVHPVHQPASRRALLFPRVEGSTAYAVTITSAHPTDALASRAQACGGVTAPRLRLSR